MKKQLTQEDVTALLADPSGANRADMAAKMASRYDKSTLSPTEIQLAEEIFALMVRDAEVRVREALSANLKDNPEVPHDVARALARDVESVSLPILKFSEVLTDADLVEIIASQSTAKHVAIAGRSQVSPVVSEALVATENEQVVTHLIANNGAEISETDLHKVIDTYDEDVHAALIDRDRLPITISERLVTLVSDTLKSELVQKHHLDDPVATDLLLESRERAIIGLSSAADAGDVEVLVRQLHLNGRLTESIILRALCIGDLLFFEAAMAQMAGIPLRNARHLIHDSGRLGMRAVFTKSNLSKSCFAAARAAVEVAHENVFDGRAYDQERYVRRMLERILTQHGELGVEFEAEDLEYLLAKLGQLHSDASLTTD